MNENQPTNEESPENTQTTPEGLEIPVPKRADVMDALDKIARSSDPTRRSEE